MPRRKSTRKSTRKRPRTRKTARPKSPAPEAAVEPNELGLETTGKSIVTFMDASTAGVKRALSTLKTRAGVSNVCRMADYRATEFAMEDAEGADALMLDDLGIAVVSDDRSAALSSVQAEGRADVIVEPEYINYALADSLDDDVLDAGDSGDEDEIYAAGSGFSPEYLRGYQQAVQHLVGSLTSGGPALVGARLVEALAAFSDTATATWGLHATRVLGSSATGRSIRVAVLDTGLDLRHPDIAGRTIRTQSFITGESVQDGNGHGTHCIGTSCGPRRPGEGPRYGIAHEAEIFAGKVLSNGGRGGDSGILAGINWAVQNRCHVVSMSLGRPTRLGERPMQSYETAGSRAIRAGTLIVAAAGNESHRPFVIKPVGSPANASLIVAVAAVDSNLRVAPFSNRGINPQGGEINFAGPGVGIRSIWRLPLRHRTINGTSMATPHVAGIAALIAQQSSVFRGIALYRELRRRVRRLPLSRADVGNGLVQAI